MLRVFLVTSPRVDQAVALAESLLAATPAEPVAGLLMSRGLRPSARALGTALGVGSVEVGALESAAAAVTLIEARAERSSGPLVLVVDEAVARAVVTHALDAPVEGDRIAFDPGGIAEIEVRLDSPWTVNRLNDLCHQAPAADGGIVRT